MILDLDDYVDRDVDPTAPFIPHIVHEDALRAALLNPAAALPPEIQTLVLQSQGTDALRVQQHLIYRVGRTIGILHEGVAKARGALQAFDPLMQGTISNTTAMVLEAAATSIGTASDAIAAVPIVGWIIKALAAAIEAGLKLAAGIEASLEPGRLIGAQPVAADDYRGNADADLINLRLLTQAQSRDWTTLFMPSMTGELAAQIRQDASGRIVIAWGLQQNGSVPRIVIDSRGLKQWTYHFSDAGGVPFEPSGGLGAVPGSTRIVSVVQSALVERGGPHRGHESYGDPRCGSSRKTVDVDVGTWFHSTASGAAALFGYCTKAGAPAYTLATQEIVNAWQAYVDTIWEGIERLWRNESWEGGWGCGPWQNALQGLARAHCVGADGQIGSFGAWAPTRYEKRLTSADRNAWEANNICTKIIKPAMIDLREMQLALLRKTPMAAYLPATGLGSMRDPSVKEAFETARQQLVERPRGALRRRAQLRWGDVVDPWYRDMLERASIGSKDGSGGIEPGDYKPPRIAMPQSGGGRAGIILVGGLAALAAAGLVIRSRRRR